MQSTNTIVLIKPKHFAFNSQTAATNSFQNNVAEKDAVLAKAQKEFDDVVSALKAREINCLVFEDRNVIACADAVFCNNWFSTHSNGNLFIYPMCTPNRRLEVRDDILMYLQNSFTVTQVIDLRTIAQENEYLESTGSLVFDHNNNLAFACLSERTNENLVTKIGELLNYKTVFYNCVDDNNLPIYHTNVILCITSYVIVAFIDGIKDEVEKENLLYQFSVTQKEIILINYQQVKAFCGNMLAIHNSKSKEFLVLSKTAYQAFSKDQIHKLTKLHELIAIDIPTIETVGGGGVRCMLGQVFLSPKK